MVYQVVIFGLMKTALFIMPVGLMETVPPTKIPEEVVVRKFLKTIQLVVGGVIAVLIKKTAVMMKAENVCPT